MIKYSKRMGDTRNPNNCDFCQYVKQGEFLLESKYFGVVPNLYPYQKNHVLLIPKRHCHSRLEFTEDECSDFCIIDKELVKLYKNTFSSCFSFVREGTPGQSMWHFHQHYMPHDNFCAPNIRRERYCGIDVDFSELRELLI